MPLPNLSEQEMGALFASFMQHMQVQQNSPQPVSSSSLPLTQPLSTTATTTSSLPLLGPSIPPPSQAQPPLSHPPLTQPGSSRSAPVTTVFQPMAGSSIQSPLGHPQPQAALRQRTNFHPFLPMTLPTSQANQARMASAASTLPRSASLVRRGRRGPAQHPPGLQAIRPRRVSAEQCFTTDMMGGQVLRLTVKVLPPTPQGSELRYQLYQNLQESVTAFLDTYSLLHHLDLPPATPVFHLLQQVAQTMESSELQYVFENPTRLAFLAPHERVPLQLLGLTARGVIRPTGEIRLHRRATNSQLTLQDVAADRNCYSAPVCIENDRLVLYLTPRFPAIQFTQDGKQHHCLSKRFFKRFAGDGSSEVTFPDDDGSTSGGEETDDLDPGTDNDLEMAEVETAVVLASRLQTRTARNNLRQTAQQLTSADEQTPALAASTAGLVSLPAYLPSSIWTDFSPVPVSPNDPIYSIEKLSDNIYAAATAGLGLSGDELILDVRASSLSGLADTYQEAIGNAAASGDFTSILLPQRHFAVCKENGAIETMGAGVEKEALYSLFAKYTAGYSAWFSPRFDGRATLQTSRSFAASGFISSSRLQQVKVLGAICALLLIGGICPEPFSPLLFYVITQNFDPRSLTRDIVGEWHPVLRDDLDQWMAIGPAGDPSAFRGLFLSWLGINTGVLVGRDESTHRSYASEILWSAIMGQEPWSHPEMQAFAEGFRLSCRNGFTFTKVPQQFAGGPGTFFTTLWTSAISGYDSISLHYHVSSSGPSVKADITRALRNVGDGITLDSLIRDFLKGSGIPCPDLFAEVEPSFSSLIDITEIDSPAFRPKVFAWAISGSPTVDPAQEEMTVEAVADSDRLYASPELRNIMAQDGKISFRTCMASARIPASYIIRLACQVYPSTSSSHPQSFQQAFDHWFLCELLGAIGGHTMY